MKNKKTHSNNRNWIPNNTEHSNNRNWIKRRVTWGTGALICLTRADAHWFSPGWCRWCLLIYSISTLLNPLLPIPFIFPSKRTVSPPNRHHETSMPNRFESNQHESNRRRVAKALKIKWKRKRKRKKKSVWYSLSEE